MKWTQNGTSCTPDPVRRTPDVQSKEQDRGKRTSALRSSKCMGRTLH